MQNKATTFVLKFNCIYCFGSYHCITKLTKANHFMTELTQPQTDAIYKTRIEISRDGQNTLYAEQARRQLKGERLTLVELASEIVEQSLTVLKQQHDANPIG
jgi:hypothetical protein